MCGIVGYVGPREATEFLVVGLHRLEYRGYDSAGVATITPEGQFAVVKTAGRIDRLEALLGRDPAPGQIGIGHTRWATHGAPSDVNAHPHVGGNGTLALVHNGVIENFQAIKQRLAKRRLHVPVGDRYRGHRPSDRQLPEASAAGGRHGGRRLSAAGRARSRRPWRSFRAPTGWRSSSANGREVLIAARLGSPLVVGVGADEHFVASDASPLAGYTDKIVYLADHELAVVTADSLRVIHRDQGHVNHSVHVLGFPGRRHRQGRLRPLHAQGDFRAARIDRERHARPARSRRGHGEVRRLQPHAAAASRRRAASS